MDTLIFHRIGICVHQRFIRLHPIGLRRTDSKNKPNFVFHRRERRARREIFNIFLYALCLLALVARYVSNNVKKYQKRSKMSKNYQNLPNSHKFTSKSVKKFQKGTAMILLAVFRGLGGYGKTKPIAFIKICASF